MANQDVRAITPEMLEFPIRPPINWDPIPWPWFFDKLDLKARLEIARVQLELQNQVLQAQIEANEKLNGVLEQSLK